MQKQVYALICLALAAGLGALIVLVFNSASLFWMAEFFVATAAAGIMALICLINFLLGRRQGGTGRRISPWRLFVIIDLVLMALLGAWSLWDMSHDKGFMAGMGGTVGLLFGVPLLAALLIVELLVYKTVRMNKGPENTDEDKQAAAPPVDIIGLKKDDWRNEK